MNCLGDNSCGRIHILDSNDVNILCIGENTCVDSSFVGSKISQKHIQKI